MISSVVLAGTLKERINKTFRYVEAIQIDALRPSKEIVHRIPVQYWTKSDQNVLLNRQEGTQLVIKGRLESDEKMGIYVLVESVNFYMDKEKEEFSKDQNGTTIETSID